MASKPGGANEVTSRRATTRRQTARGLKPGTKERAAERRTKAIEMRKRGATFRVIAQALGVSVRTAYIDVQKSLAELRAFELADAADVKALELERIDLVVRGAMRRAIDGDPHAGNTVLRAIEMRSRLLGLFAPTSMDLSGSVRVDTVQAVAARLREAGLE